MQILCGVNDVLQKSRHNHDSMEISVISVSYRNSGWQMEGAVLEKFRRFAKGGLEICDDRSREIGDKSQFKRNVGDISF